MKKFDRSNIHRGLSTRRRIAFLALTLCLAASVSPLTGQYTLTVNLVGQGSVTLNPPGGSYPGGTVVTLTAQANSGHVFSGWQGALSGYASPRNLTINASVTVTAIFTEIPTPLYPQGIWISAEELDEFPMSGAAWLSLKAAADQPTGDPNLADRANQADVRTMAKGLVYARTGIESYRTEAITACMAAIGTETGGSPPTVSRGLLGYIIAADLVGLPAPEDSIFRAWLRQMLTKSLSGGTLQTVHEKEPNNRGTHCGASRAAIARYLGDEVELARSALVFKGYLGDRQSFAGFTYGSDLSWQADPANPVGINPLGATKEGHSIDGVLPDDQRAKGPFTWPPPTSSDVYEALQGALAHAVILGHAGYDAWSWQDQALLRSFLWLYNEANHVADGDDECLPHLINHYYNTTFPTDIPADPAKNFGWADWTHPPRPRLTINIIGEGQVTLNPPGGVYPHGTIVSLSPAAAPGWTFAGWDGALKGYAKPDSMELDSDRVVTAIFLESARPPYKSSIWISREEVQQLPMSGPAWQNVKTNADKPAGPPNLSNQDDSVNVRIMAKALVYARTGVESYREEVINACMDAIGTEYGGRTLALGRELLAYVISADLVGLPAAQDLVFRNWLRGLLTLQLENLTLQSAHEKRPNNWGTHCGASRAAVAIYLGDRHELARTALIFKGWLGDRSAYAGFSYSSDFSWHADPANPVGINPTGATRDGHSIDGVQPDDQNRCGPFVWPPCKTNYTWEAMQGALALAHILHRQGYGAWKWEDQALRRALEWLHNTIFDDGQNYPARNDDEWLPHLANYFYQTNFPAPPAARPGKNAGWTDWTHGANALALNARAFLEGPFQSGGMHTTLRDKGLLPLQQPFHNAPWHYGGAEHAEAVPEGVVDWVLVELQASPGDPGKTRRAAFIKKDGSIVDLDGRSAVRFYGAAPGNYYIAVYHRNHLAIMSSRAVALEHSAGLYDFTSAQNRAYGTNPMKILSGGVYGMIAGDGNGDGAVNEIDRQSVWRIQNGTAWEYGKSADFNLDGGIDSDDLNFFWRANNGSATQVPGGSLAKPVHISSAPQRSAEDQ